MKCTKYNAQDISATLINFANKNNYRLTNLQLQKILYFTQVEYIKKNDKLLFEDEFQAWSYGPVIYNVWRPYNLYNRNHISEIKIGKVVDNKALNKFITENIEMYFRKNVWDLVDLSHKQKPWKSTVANNKKFISNKVIYNFARSL